MRIPWTKDWTDEERSGLVCPGPWFGLILYRITFTPNYSTFLLHMVELKTLRAFELHPSNEIFFVVGLDVLMKASLFNWQRQPLWLFPCFWCPFYGFIDVLPQSLRGGVFASHIFIEEDVASTWKSWFSYNHMRGRDCPTELAKFCNHKIYEQMKFVFISKNLGTISNICYKRTNVMSFDSISLLSDWFFI